MTQNSTGCLECRLASGGGLLGGSIYLIHHSRKFKHFSRYVVSSFGAALGLLGILRIFNLPPFKTQLSREEDVKPDLFDQETYIVDKLPSKFN